jgi:hypothetical protein
MEGSMMWAPPWKWWGFHYARGAVAMPTVVRWRTIGSAPFARIYADPANPDLIRADRAQRLIRANNAA